MGDTRQDRIDREEGRKSTHRGLDRLPGMCYDSALLATRCPERGKVQSQTSLHLGNQAGDIIKGSLASVLEREGSQWQRREAAIRWARRGW